MKIKFYGAARTVTGSKHLIETENKKILLDCGLFQGRRKDTWHKNKNLPFNPHEIDAVILSHAHIDHCGALPILVKNGFKGKIFCTPSTADIAKVMLFDSASIQESDAIYFARKLFKTALRPIEPLYTKEDVLKTENLFQPIPLYKEFEVLKNVKGKFFNAAHVIGSASLFLEVKENRKTKTLAFTGDLGRKNRSILKNPDFITKAEVLITESTYGGKVHNDNLKNREKLQEIVNATYKKRGKLIIPSFALERTQEIIFDLNILKEEKKIPKLPVFIDSPLANKVTEIFQEHAECFDEEAQKKFFDKGKNPFEDIVFTKTTQESKFLNTLTIPCIIISASGMCEGGRIRHHLSNNVTNEKNTILIVGYQAEHTLGRRIVERRPTLKIFDRLYPLKADVEVMNGFSAHADNDDLVEFTARIDGLKKVFVVHGENDRIFKLIKSLRNLHRDFEIDAPEEGDEVEI